MGQRDQVLQQQCAGTTVVHVIGDGQGDLGRPGRGIVALVTAATDQLTVHHGEQRGVVRRGLTTEPARLPFGRTRIQAEETQVETVWGQLLVHLPHRIEVLRPRRPDLDRGAVSQQSVHPGLGVCAHCALPGSATADDAELIRITGHRDDGLPGTRSADPCPRRPAARSRSQGIPAAVIDPTRRSSCCMKVAFGWRPRSCMRARCCRGSPPQCLVDVDALVAGGERRPASFSCTITVPAGHVSQATNRAMAEMARFTNVRHEPTPADRDRGCRLRPPRRHR